MFPSVSLSKFRITLYGKICFILHGKLAINVSKIAEDVSTTLSDNGMFKIFFQNIDSQVDFNDMF